MLDQFLRDIDHDLAEARENFAASKDDEDKVFWSHKYGRLRALRIGFKAWVEESVSKMGSLTTEGLKAEIIMAKRQGRGRAQENLTTLLNLFQAWSNGDIDKYETCKRRS